MDKNQTLNQNKTERFNITSISRFSYKSVIPFFTVLGLYTLWVVFALDGPRGDHILLLVGLTVIYFFNKTGQKMVLGFLFLIFYWMVFDSIRLWPNYEYATIHIGDLYQNELNWFGIQTAEGKITANEYFGIHNHTFFDIYTAIIYICWIPVPFTFAMYLFFSKRRKVLVKFLFAFLSVSLFGLLFQYIYPAAPPWYVELYGTEGAFQEVSGNPGRLINFDKYFGVNVFSGMYNLNANVYAAVPSLHCAFPIIQLFFAIKYKFKKWGIFFTILMISTWFSAVYTNHHYIIDVLCGITTALIAIATYSLLIKTKYNDFLNKYGNTIS